MGGGGQDFGWGRYGGTSEMTAISGSVAIPTVCTGMAALDDSLLCLHHNLPVKFPSFSKDDTLLVTRVEYIRMPSCTVKCSLHLRRITVLFVGSWKKRLDTYDEL